MINSLKLILLALLLTSCSSVSKKETQYYLLNQYTEIVNEPGPTPDKLTKHETHTINLKKIRLPEYLNQPYLVIQLSEHQLHYAHSHLWAESLQAGITKSLAIEINKTDSFLQLNINDSNQLANDSLSLEINHFYPTNNSTVILAGKFWLSNSNNQILIPETDFKFESDLLKNGYPNSVAEMRRLVGQLSSLLVNKISALKNNNNRG